MMPSVCSLESCAIAAGGRRSAVILRRKKRIEQNPILEDNFFTFCTLHSISTCCALLRFTLGSISGWGSQFERRRLATSNSHLLAAGVVSPAPHCTASPGCQTVACADQCPDKCTAHAETLATLFLLRILVAPSPRRPFTTPPSSFVSIHPSQAFSSRMLVSYPFVY